MEGLNSTNYLSLVTIVTNKDKVPSLDEVFSMIRKHERKTTRMNSMESQLVQANLTHNNFTLLR